MLSVFSLKNPPQKFYPYLLNGKIEIEIKKNVYSNIAFDVDCVSENNYKISLNVTSKLFDKEDKLSSVTFTMDNGNFHFDNVDMNFSDKQLKTFGDDYVANAVIAIINMYRLINAYFFHFKQDISEVQVKEVTRKSVPVKGGKYKYQQVKHLHKLYTLKNVNTRKVAKARQWHLDCWDVVGHIRHYKNGKEVYIKLYTKGKGRKTDKIYKI